MECIYRSFRTKVVTATRQLLSQAHNRIFWKAFVLIFSLYGGYQFYKIRKHYAMCAREIEDANDGVERWLAYMEYGRMGNMLFQYAASYCIARKSGRTFVLLNDATTMDLFPRTRGEAVIKPRAFFTGTQCREEFREKHSNAHDPRLLQKALNTNLRGLNISYSYLQSFKYFDDCKDDIKRLLSPMPEVQTEINRTFRMVLSRNSAAEQDMINSVTCIHVRRGDFVSEQMLKYGFNPTSIPFLKAAMEYVKSRNPGNRFLVFSDDPAWCSLNVLPLRNDIELFKLSSFFDQPMEKLKRIFPTVQKTTLLAPLFELHMRAQCARNIITGGSFGWWGAWLSGGLTVYDKNYPVPNTRLDYDTNRNTYYPVTWISL